MFCLFHSVQINLLVLQASTEFNAQLKRQLDQASLLVGCVSNIQVQLMNRMTAKQKDSNAPSPVQKKMKLEEMLSGSRYGLHTSDQDTPSEKLETTAIGLVNIGRVHCQLQGLDCTHNKEKRHRHMSGITSIPQTLSKVMFTLMPHTVNEDPENPEMTVLTSNGASLMECGIEGITINVGMQCAPVTPQPSTGVPSRSHSRQPSQNWQVSPEFHSTDAERGFSWSRTHSVTDILNPTSATELRHSDITLAVRKQAKVPTKSRSVDGKMVISTIWLHAPTPCRLSHEHSAGVQ